MPDAKTATPETVVKALSKSILGSEQPVPAYLDCIQRRGHIMIVTFREPTPSCGFIHDKIVISVGALL